VSVIILIVAYIALLSAVYCKDYKKILTLNTVSCLLAALYLALNGAYVGGSVSALAGIASICQLCMPMQQTRKNTLTRNTIAVLFTVLAVSLLYSRPSDILPCLAHFMNRVCEAQVNEQMVRLGISVSALLWATYGLQNSLPLFALAEGLIGLGAISAFIFYAKKRQLAEITIDQD